MNMICPGNPRLLTSKRAASHSCGVSCHSSISLGVSPESSASGSESAIIRLDLNCLGSSMYMTLLACCTPVVVFPHHFGPCISTIPEALSWDSSNPSAILGLYVFMSKFFVCKNIYKILDSQRNNEFRSPSWPNFVHQVGRFLFTKLAASPHLLGADAVKLIIYGHHFVIL